MERDNQLRRLQVGRSLALWVMIAMVAVIVLVVAYFRHLMGVVAAARTSLFSVFLLIPVPVTVQLAERTVHTGGGGGPGETDDGFAVAEAACEQLNGAAAGGMLRTHMPFICTLASLATSIAAPSR